MTDTLMTADTNTENAASQDAVVETKVDAAAQQQSDPAPTMDEADKAAAAKDGDQDSTEGEDAKDEPQGAPEAYEDFTAAEGVEFDAEVLGEFKGLAKELNLPQGDAQKVADIGVKLAQKWADESQARVAEMQEGWKTATEADKEIGGDALPLNLSTAKRALDTYGSPALADLLNESGLGNHPEVIRAFVKIGKTISEDTVVTGGNAEPARGAAKVLFPNQN